MTGTIPRAFQCVIRRRTQCAEVQTLTRQQFSATLAIMEGGGSKMNINGRTAFALCRRFFSLDTSRIICTFKSYYFIPISIPLLYVSYQYWSYFLFQSVRVCQCHSKAAFTDDPQFSPLWFMKPFPFTAMSSFLQQPIQSISCSINGKGRDHRLKALCPIAINDPLQGSSESLLLYNLTCELCMQNLNFSFQMKQVLEIF